MKRNPTCGLMRPVAFALAMFGFGLATHATDWTTIWTQDFEDADTYKNEMTGDSVVNAVFGTTARTSATPSGTISQAERPLYGGGTSKFFMSYSKSSGSGNALFTLPDAVTNALAEAKAYQIEFDYYLATAFWNGNNTKTGLALEGEAGPLATFYAAQGSDKATTTAYIYKGDDSTSQLASFKTGGRGASPSTDNSQSYHAQSYWLHVTITANEEDGVKMSVTQPNRETPATILTDATLTNEFSLVTKIYLRQSASNSYDRYMDLDDVVVKTPAAVGTPDAPTIGVSGDDDDIKTVTLELAEGAGTGTKLSYSLDGTAYTFYTEPLSIQSSTFVYAKATYNNLDSEVVQTYVTAGEIPTPTGAITGVNGTSRTVAFAISGGYVFEYSTTGEDGDYTAYEDALTISKTTTFYVRAKKTSTVDDTVTLYSAVLTFAVAAGETVPLAAPTAVYLCGLDTIHADWNQSSVVASPIVETIKVTVDGVTTEYAAASTDLIDVSAYGGKALSVSLAATGYDDSPAVTYTVRRPQDEMWRLTKAVDFSALLPSVKSLSFSSSSSADPGTINAGGEAIADWLLTYNIYDSSKRTRFSNAGYRGLGVYNGVTTFTLTGLAEGQLVVVNVSTGSLGDNLTAVDGVSHSQELWGIVGADGTATFSFGRQNSTTHYLHAVSVYDRRQGLLIIVR